MSDTSPGQVRCLRLDQSVRKELRASYRLPWPTFKMVLQLAVRNSPGSVESLRSLVETTSGIGVLRDELEQRLFSRSKMIKAWGAWQSLGALPDCRRTSAQYKIRLSNLLHDAQQSSGCLAEQIDQGVADLMPVQNYIVATRQITEDDLDRAGDALRQLGEIQLQLEDAYQDMTADVQMLEFVDRHKDEMNADVGTAALPVRVSWTRHPGSRYALAGGSGEAGFAE